MKYTVTSAEASKMLKKILEEKSILLANERQSSVFNASLGEDVESVRPVANSGAVGPFARSFRTTDAEF